MADKPTATSKDSSAPKRTETTVKDSQTFEPTPDTEAVRVADAKTQDRSQVTVDTSSDDFVFVTMQDGSTRAFTRQQIRESQARSATEAQNGTFDQPEAPEVEEEVYLWLANGDVERVKASKVPSAAGTNAASGYFERDDKVHYVVACYPVESDKNKKG